ncbi:PPE domain-containing protein [Glycomyces sp. NPDC046736]|uniref:PPE domain-containing protein n=1 Tax=Glycomyces sp. NPDC046736 TaxID=3155615 RepID=UPI0033DB718C
MSMGQDIFDAGNEMSPVYEDIISGCAIAIMPPALVFGLSVQAVATSIYMNQCNPGDMFKAAGAWIVLAEKNTEAAEALAAQTARVNDENWKGTDAEAFKNNSSDVQAQLQQLAITAFLIAAQLIALGIALTVFWVFLLAVTVVMDAFLVAYVAAYAGVITAVGAEAIRASCLTVASALLATTKSFEATMSAISSGCAAVTALLTVITFAYQDAKGNPVTIEEIAKGSLTNQLLGLGTFAERALLMTPGGKHASLGATEAFKHGVNSQGGFGIVDSLAETYYDDNESLPEDWRDPTDDEISWT